MADNVVPLPQRPTPKRDIESPATPREIDVFIAALQAWIKQSPSIEDPKAFWQAMREDAAEYPIDVLMQAAKQARRLHDGTPSIKEMLAICDGLMEPRRAELRAIQRAEDERRARELDAANRQREAAERAAADQRWCVDLQARLAIAGDAPSLDDVELATRLLTLLPRAGVPLTWRQFIDENPRAAADLCKRLAEIVRGEPPDRGAIARALTDAGLEAAAPAQPPRPSAEAEVPPRPIGAVLAETLAGLAAPAMTDQSEVSDE